MLPPERAVAVEMEPRRRRRRRRRSCGNVKAQLCETLHELRQPRGRRHVHDDWRAIMDDLSGAYRSILIPRQIDKVKRRLRLLQHRRVVVLVRGPITSMRSPHFFRARRFRDFPLLKLREKTCWRRGGLLPHCSRASELGIKLVNTTSCRGLLPGYEGRLPSCLSAT